YRGYEVVELPPPTQGVAALEALALLEGLSPDLANQVVCAALALEDAREHVRDGADVSGLLAPDFLDRRRRERPRDLGEPPGGPATTAATRRPRSTGRASEARPAPCGSRRGCGAARASSSSSDTTSSTTRTRSASAADRRSSSPATPCSAGRTRARTATPPVF